VVVRGAVWRVAQSRDLLLNIWVHQQALLCLLLHLKLLHLKLLLLLLRRVQAKASALTCVQTAEVASQRGVNAASASFVVAPPKLNWDVGWTCVVVEPKRPPVVAPVVAVNKNN